MIAQTLSLVVPKRTDVDVAEELYMPDEKTNAVLRAQIDTLKDAFSAAHLEIKELNSKVDTNHREHNKRYHGVDRKMVVLLGDGELSDGLVRQHKAAFERVWKKFKEQDAKIEQQNENTWKLKLALAGGSFLGGGGIVYALMRFLGA